MTISPEHWLSDAARVLLPGGSGMPIRRFLVIHFTSGASAMSSVEFWKSPEANGACAHLVIDRDGGIIQCRPFNVTCGHAGRSHWQGYDGLNACSIGIELANAGDGANEDGTAFESHKFHCPAGVEKARHKNGGPVTWWERYPEAQVQQCIAVAKALVERYHLDDIVGHDDIAPDRKNDPGPLFPMERLRKACGFPKEPAVTTKH